MLKKYSCGCNTLEYKEPELQNIYNMCEMHEKEIVDKMKKELKFEGLIIENNKLRAKNRAY